MQQPPLFPPGVGWSYANTGYVIVGMVIERITGRPWCEEVTTRIIDPLGLTDTRWPGDDPELPAAHSRAYMRFEVDELLVVDVDASGGLITTTQDLNRFRRAPLGSRLLRPNELDQMKRTVPTTRVSSSPFPGLTTDSGS